MVPARESDPKGQGVWVPNSYGGVTGIVLDLTQVGTDQMLGVRFRQPDDFRPWLGKNYKVHSDKTTQDSERGTKERTVVLVDSESLGEWGRKQIVCYKIFSEEDRYTKEGVKASSESTFYQLTMSEIS